MKIKKRGRRKENNNLKNKIIFKYTNPVFSSKIGKIFDCRFS